MSKYLRWAILGIVLLILVSYGVQAYRGDRLKQKAKEISNRHAQLLGSQGSLGSGECYYDSLHADQRCYINYELNVPYDSKKFDELVSYLESEGWSKESSRGYKYRQFFYERACDVSLEQNAAQLHYKLTCYH